MSYVQKFPGVQRDELLGGTHVPISIRNVNVGASAVIERGMLLGASSPTGEFAQVTSADDASKVLCIASCDFTATADSHVTQAYTSGVFNSENIKLGGTSALKIEAFEEALRHDQIILTSIKELF